METKIIKIDQDNLDHKLMQEAGFDNKKIRFFKQKTAYEIVGCDWSSDVCSSDLEKLMRHACM